MLAKSLSGNAAPTFTLAMVWAAVAMTPCLRWSLGMLSLGRGRAARVDQAHRGAQAAGPAPSGLLVASPDRLAGPACRLTDAKPGGHRGRRLRADRGRAAVVPARRRAAGHRR